jgi:hypothetical protein
MMSRTAWIVLLTAVAVSVVAMFSLVIVDRQDSNLGTGDLFLPNFENEVSELREIIIAFPGGDEVSDTDTGSGIDTTELHFWKDGQRWRLREAQDYYASINQLSTLVTGLSDMRLKEPKTKVADKHERLGLGAPEDGGSATRISMYGAENRTIVEVLLGDVASSRSGQYVRASGAKQTWLATPPLEDRLSDQATSWLERSILSIPVTQVRALSFSEDRGREYRLSREQNTAIFDITPPDGLKVANPNGLGNLAQLMEQLEYDKVLPNPTPGDKDMLDVEHTVFLETFEGFAVRAQIGYASLSENALLQLTFSASGGEEVPASVLEKVDRHNEDYGAWLYEISDETMQSFIFDAENVFVEITEDESNANADKDGK